jgi:hypothetical protein
MCRCVSNDDWGASCIARSFDDVSIDSYTILSEEQSGIATIGKETGASFVDRNASDEFDRKHRGIGPAANVAQPRGARPSDAEHNKVFVVHDRPAAERARGPVVDDRVPVVSPARVDLTIVSEATCAA